MTTLAIAPATWRTLYDAEAQHAAAIPRDAQLVAGYIPPSEFAWTDADWAEFPDAVHVRITVEGAEPDAHGASIIDVERGAFTALQAARFVRERKVLHPDRAPTVYVDVANLSPVLSACRGLDYCIWIASWLGRRPTPYEVIVMRRRMAAHATLVAWQYENMPYWDESVVLDPRWHPGPPD
jgi:hypothetical protein